MDLTQQIEALDLSELERAWEVTVKWVCRNLKNIKEGTITRAARDLRSLAEAKKQRESQGESSTMDATSEGERAAEEAMRQQFRAELRQELRQELKKELRQELQRELQVEQQPGVEPEPQRQSRVRKRDHPVRRSHSSAGRAQEMRVASDKLDPAPRTFGSEENQGLLVQSNLDLLLIDDEQAQASRVEIDEDWEALLNDELEGVRITEPEK